MKLVLFSLIYLLVSYVLAVITPGNVVSGGQAVYNNLPLQDKAGTLKNAVKRVVEGKNPVPGIKANYYKKQMVDSIGKAEKYQKINDSTKALKDRIGNTSSGPSSPSRSPSRSSSTDSFKSALSRTPTDRINDKVSKHTADAQKFKQKYDSNKRKEEKVIKGPGLWNKAKNAVKTVFKKSK